MPDETAPKVKTYYFTFTSSSELNKYYVAIQDTYGNARSRMHKIFGDRWAFQYHSKEEAGIDRFNLKCLINL